MWLALSHCWHSHFPLQHMLGNFTNHSTLITLWLWMFIFLPRTSVTQLSLYPPLLYCITHQILLGRRKPVSVISQHCSEWWDESWWSWAEQTWHLRLDNMLHYLKAHRQLWIMSELTLLRFRITSLLCSRTYQKNSLEYWVLSMFDPARRPGTISISQCGFSPF